tara:strand:+ start:245 stop:394 length:150 start_codon:yes stop_codon:yes gene_type:complete
LKKRKNPYPGRYKKQMQTLTERRDFLKKKPAKKSPLAEWITDHLAKVDD